MRDSDFPASTSFRASFRSKAHIPHQQRGFTLVELMIVVAIIGVLAALAVYGVKRYLSHSKTAEARQTVGAISRAAAVAFENERTGAELLTLGSSAGNASGGTLCDDAAGFVPASLTMIQSKKYQPKTGNNEDFNTDNTIKGWRCLKFSISQPISYAYSYHKDLNPNAAYGDQCTGNPNFYALAVGDLDGNNQYSWYSRCGMVVNSQLKLSTQLHTFLDGE